MLFMGKSTISMTMASIAMLVITRGYIFQGRSMVKNGGDDHGLSQTDPIHHLTIIPLSERIMADFECRYRLALYTI